MITHLVRIILIILLIALCIVYPFLPGEYDSLAMPLSTIAQGFGVLGVLLVPVGALWLIAELRQTTIRVWLGLSGTISAPSGLRITCILSSRASCWITSARGSSWSTTRWMSISWSATPPLCCG
jgi:hypothetical protein